MADWVGIAETTIRKYIRDVEDDILRSRKLLAMLQAQGRIQYGATGTEMDWKIKYKRAIPKGYADLDTVTFPRRNRHKTAVIGYRAYNLSESISKFDQLKNRGAEAIVKLLESKTQFMTEDFEEFFGEQLYVDGNASGNSKLMHGIESFLGTSGASAGNKIALPSDSYAGLQTDLGYYGGSATGTWPNGTAPTEYDFFSPLLVDYTNTGWTATTKTWPNTCVEAVRFGLVQGHRNKSKRGQVNMVLMDRELYRLWVENQSVKERINVQLGSGGKGDSLTALGFGDVFNFEGAELTSEYGIPANVAYGFNTQMMELHSMQDQLFDLQGPFENEEDKSLRWSLDFFGNMRFFPRQFIKWAAYS